MTPLAFIWIRCVEKEVTLDCFAQWFLTDNFTWTDCIKRLWRLFAFPSRDSLLTWVTQVHFLKAFCSLFANTAEAVKHWTLGFPLPRWCRQIVFIQTLQCCSDMQTTSSKLLRRWTFLNPAWWPANLWSLLFTWLLHLLIGAPVCVHPSRDKRRWRGSKRKV